ncbi:hypothetical protein FRC01_005762 [Tulasnella sp. 417]|nr:hypothetical protein FRC01_005762 [Tulasnella sp. 417]
MPPQRKSTRRSRLLRLQLLAVVLRDLFTPTEDLIHRANEISTDTAILLAILQTRYLAPRLPLPKAGQLHLAFEFAAMGQGKHRFVQMLRVTPDAFHHILSLIQDHPIFTCRGPRPQAPVELQLAVTLYRAGRYGNGSSVGDIARIAGVSEGSVLKFTERCIAAILSLENHALRRPTAEEKEREKEWVERRVGCPSFRDGWCTGDGTLVHLHQKPGLNGDAYFSRKMQYDLNVQIVNLFTSLRVVDYVTGFCGSAHDSAVFQYSAVSLYPNWFFEDGEFMWADSAYTVSPHVIPVHKKPASDNPLNTQFDAAVAQLRIRSEHCMGALKGRWQSLRGLRIIINRKRDHKAACNWIRMCIILHNLVVDIEGEEWAQYYLQQVPPEREEHVGREAAGGLDGEGDNRRKTLVAEYAVYKQEIRRLRGFEA